MWYYMYPLFHMEVDPTHVGVELWKRVSEMIDFLILDNMWDLSHVKG